MKKLIITSMGVAVTVGLALSLISNERLYGAKVRKSVVPETVTQPEGGLTSAVAPKKIFLALLLDTSNSMDGLIDQAKSQLWNIVDEMTNATYDDQPADLHIALYEYGNDNLSITSGYVRQVSPFSQDLDEISTQLFNLKTRGGSEYCGTVINKSLESLNWSDNPKDLKLIFIAGNEAFDQGLLSYESACKKAAERNTVVNTIFCGGFEEGVKTLWKKGAEIGGGSYMNIDMDQQTVYVKSPYDPVIDSLNEALNKTYIGYGKQGRARKAKQIQEDNNAASYSQSNKVKRAISKSKHVYKNESWDLVDAVKTKKVEVEKIETEDLPTEMKTLSSEEKKAYVNKKIKEREAVKKQIKELASSRKAYVKGVKDSLNAKNELESAIVEAVKEKAKEKSFVFKDE